MFPNKNVEIFKFTYYSEPIQSQNPQLHTHKKISTSSSGQAVSIQDLQTSKHSESLVCNGVQRFCSDVPQVKRRVCLLVNFSNDGSIISMGKRIK